MPVSDLSPAPIPRSDGWAHLRVKSHDGTTAIDHLRSSGALKLLFPRSNTRLDAILINTSGGLTGGDKMAFQAQVGRGAVLGLTTQAAERAYRAADGVAQVHSHITVEQDSTLTWLPQELIVFDGAALERSLHIELETQAKVLMVEPIVFGRAAMGETVHSVHFSDLVEITRAGKPLYTDQMRFSGDFTAQMARPAMGNGACAMASLVYVAPDADRHLSAIRAALPQTGGASLLHQDVLVMRILASDGFDLRRYLLPILDRLTQNSVPAPWRL